MPKMKLDIRYKMILDKWISNNLHANLVPRHRTSCLIIPIIHLTVFKHNEIFDFAFVAFLVSVHGVASFGGENLKSPEENNK